MKYLAPLLFLPSIALGQLGPPRLSKLLIEAFLIRTATGTDSIEGLMAISPKDLRTAVLEYVEANPRVVSLVTTIGIPILRDRDGAVSLTRGPKLNIPVPSPDGKPVPITEKNRERFAVGGWVDLREQNFEVWHERIRKLAASRPDIATSGSAAFAAPNYMSERFVPGDVVGWVLTNEVDDLGMVGRRLY